MTDQSGPFQSRVPAGRDGFGQLLHAEWTKFRTVRGWPIGIVIGGLVMVGLGVFLVRTGIGCQATPGGPVLTGRACLPPITRGPGGEPVNDSFYFVHRPLTGNGSLTVRVTSLTGEHMSTSAVPANGNPGADLTPGLVPWAKAGIIVKQSTQPGSPYAAVMVTGGHGVRMQYDYTGDVAGPAAGVSTAAPRWLRLTRAGDRLTGFASVDGTHWTEVGTTVLPGLPSTVQAGLFVTSPTYVVTTTSFGGSSSGPSVATARFDHLSLAGGAPAGGAWRGTAVGSANAPSPGGAHRTGGRYTVSGSGDIAPIVHDDPVSGYPTGTIQTHLIGAFAGMIAMVVVAALFIVAEYRRGLIRTTLAASPRRGRVLAAKAIVIGAVTFVVGLVAAGVCVVLGDRFSAEEGVVLIPVTSFTEVRVVAGTAALLALAAVLGLAIGTMLRRSAAAVAAVIVAIVLPYVLGVASVLPLGAAEWLLRVTPAAAFAIQQSLPQYAQVTANYTPFNGYFPLAPWAGLAVLCGYTALALTGATFLLRHRDT